MTMETMLHSMYVVAIKDTAAWDGDSPAELSMIGLWNLVVVWLKVCDKCGKELMVVADTLAVFPFMGLTGWDGPAREYDSMCTQQLLDTWFLEILA